jgi:TRAP-type C4-dicarboxylate transport system substrate-binding protein
MLKIVRLLVAVAGLFGLGADASAATLKIATLSPDGTSWMVRMRAAAETIAKRTDGRVQFKFYPGGVMGSDDAVLRKIRAGQLQGGMLSTGGLDGIYRDASVYSLPLLFRSFDEVDYVRARMDAVIAAGLEKNGFVSFGLADGGFVYMFSSAAVRGIDDAKGRKVWVPTNDAVSRVIFDAAGISPVALPLADVMTGLQTGMIDTVPVSPVAAVALQWYTRLKFVTDTPLLYIYGSLIVDRRAFDKLAPADQAVVREIMGQAFKEIDRQNRVDHLGARDALKREGIEFVTVTPEQVAQWEKVADTARERLARAGIFTESVFKILQDHLADYRRKPQRAGS